MSRWTDWALGVWGVALLTVGVLLLLVAAVLLIVLAWQSRAVSQEQSLKLDAIYATVLGSLVGALDRAQVELRETRQALDKLEGFLSAHDGWEREREQARAQVAGERRRVTDLSPFPPA